MEKTKVTTADRLASRNARRTKSETMLIVGLGNTGDEYANTRHNAGFMLVDRLQQEWNAVPWKERKMYKAQLSEVIFNDQKIILVKPTTFMNLSGEAVSLLVNFYKIDYKNLWVIYDDLDLPLGKIRLRTDGSAGTHNGMKSILTSVPANTFPRLRIGIESRGENYEYEIPKQIDTSSFVLGKFTQKERPPIEKSLKNGVKAMELALKEGMAAAMNEWN